MRSRSFLCLIAAAALVASSSAHAGALTAATWTQTIQGVSLTITNSSATCTNVDPNHVQQTITCPGSGLGATGSASAANYSASLTMPFFSLSQFTTGGSIPLHTKATLSGSQTLGGTNSGAIPNQGVPGGVTIRVAAHAGMGVNASLLTPAMTTLLKVPLSVGKAGTYTGTFTVSGSTHYITVDFYAWSPHTLTFTGLTSKFAALPDVVAMGTFNLTAGGGGTVSLVSPSKISIDGLFAPVQRRTASFTTLTLSYAPEPGTLLLLGAAVAGLVWVGSRKRK